MQISWSHVLIYLWLPTRCCFAYKRRFYIHFPIVGREEDDDTETKPLLWRRPATEKKTREAVEGLSIAA